MGGIGLELSAENLSQAQQNTTLSNTSTTTPQQERVQNVVQILKKHPDLEQIITAWPELPEHIKRAIKALTQTHIKE